MTRAVPLPSKTFIDQDATDTSTIYVDDPKQAPVSIPIAVDRLKGDGALVQKVLQAQSCSVAERLLTRASRVMRLRSIDVCDPDLLSLQPDRVAIDHAVVAATDKAEGEVGPCRSARVGSSS